MKKQQESRAIILRDQSSSMTWVPGFPDVWNEQILPLCSFAPNLKVTLYSVTQSISKLHDGTPADALEKLNPSLWYVGQGGMLAGGTALGDAIVRGCQKAKQFRRTGYTGTLGIFLLTDGWSKDDSIPEFVVRNWLDYARSDLKVTFRLFGFVHPKSAEKLKHFCTSVGILPHENKSLCYQAEEELDSTMITSLEQLGTALQVTAQDKWS